MDKPNKSLKNDYLSLILKREELALSGGELASRELSHLEWLKSKLDLTDYEDNLLIRQTKEKLNDSVAWKSKQTLTNTSCIPGTDGIKYSTEVMSIGLTRDSDLAVPHLLPPNMNTKEITINTTVDTVCSEDPSGLVSSFRWNQSNTPVNELTDDSVVRGTSYGEIHTLIGTSGCSNDGMGWSWNVLGVLDTPRGKLVVNPGDWVVEFVKGNLTVISNKEYLSLNNHPT